jgi:hypothetical protein
MKNLAQVVGILQRDLDEMQERVAQLLPGVMLKAAAGNKGKRD